MSRHVLCSALVVATLTLTACSSACVQAQGQDAHSPAAQALADLRASAEAGDAGAQFILGSMYVIGDSVPPDAAEAVAWYRRAAEQGHARAQYNLGGLYAEGRGVPPDAVEALMWFTIAAARSTGAEREPIVTVRAALAVRMTPTDVREAERRAQAWLAANQGIIRGRVDPRTVINSDGWRGYHGLVDLGDGHFRVDHARDEFAKGTVHLNGIEGFWGLAKVRLTQFKGLPKHTFHLHLKETEWRYNHRRADQYKCLLQYLCKNPLSEA